MRNPLPKDASYVYHYTSAEVALDFILNNGTIKLNPFDKVNDPRESKHWEFSTVVRSDLRPSLEEYEKLSRSVSDSLKLRAKLACFSLDKDSAVGKWQPEALLERGFAKPSLWHHYGSQHRGVCLMFDRFKLDKAIRSSLSSYSVFGDRVVYSDDGILPELSNSQFSIDLTNVHGDSDFSNAIAAHAERWFWELFFKKLKDWGSEDEYRWVAFDSSIGASYVPFGEALEGVVLGEKFDGSRVVDIERYCVKYKSELISLSWVNGYPRIYGFDQPFLTKKHFIEDEPRG